MGPAPPSVFISYSRADEAWKEQLVEHLQALAKRGALEVWDDRRIGAGEDWRGAIERAMESARIALLLVTRRFLASEFVQNDELPRLLARRQGEGLRVVCVLVKPCDWEAHEQLHGIEVWPPGGERFISSGSEHEVEADFAALAKNVRHWLSLPEAERSINAKAPVIPGITTAAQRIINERPSEWELRLMSRVLSDELDELTDLRQELEFGVHLGPQRHLTMENELSWVREQLGRVRYIVESAARIIEIGMPKAFGAAGGPANAAQIVRAAKKLGEVYREAATSVLELRSADFDEGTLQEVAAFCEKHALILLNDIERWNTMLRGHVERIRSRESASDGEVQVVEVRFDFTKPDPAEVQAALAKFEELEARYEEGS